MIMNCFRNLLSISVRPNVYLSFLIWQKEYKSEFDFAFFFFLDFCSIMETNEESTIDSDSENKVIDLFI